MPQQEAQQGGQRGQGPGFRAQLPEQSPRVRQTHLGGAEEEGLEPVGGPPYSAIAGQEAMRKRLEMASCAGKQTCRKVAALSACSR